MMADPYIDFRDLTGAHDFRIAPVEPLPAEHKERWEQWIQEGNHAGMGYMERYAGLRDDPAALLEGARSIIVSAFNYTPRIRRDIGLPQIAAFAYGEDYHDVIRRRLDIAVEEMQKALGGEWRICVDSAPIFERAWAERSGLGERCDNGLIAVRGAGTRILLAEIISTIEFPGLRSILYRNAIDIPAPAKESCLHCGLCSRNCPTGALQKDSTVDARRCLSYLTIEHKGDLPDWLGTGGIDIPLFGCDICQDVCPLNNPLRYEIQPTEIEEFSPSDTILKLDREMAGKMTQSEFTDSFRRSPIKRTRLSGLLRNAKAPG